MAKNKGALLLGILGGILAVVTVIPGIILLWRLVIRKKLWPSQPKKYQNKESYAIVTGAAGGIGRAFAERFAKEGYNIIAMDRAAEPLKQVADNIKQKYNVKVIESVTDFIAMDKNDEWNKINEIIEGKDIAVLVNNVGICNYLPDKFGDLSTRDINNMVSLNIRTLLMMTHICIPEMLKREQKSLIINMSSSTSGYPHPMIQVYSSTKAFVRQFTDSIHYEYKNKIDCIAYCPWYIKTDMTMINETAIYAMTASDFVDSAFEYFGQTNHVNPFWFHMLMDIGSSAMPESIFADNVLKTQSFVKYRLGLKLQKKKEEEAKKNN